MTVEEINLIDPLFKKLICLNQKQTSKILGVCEGTLENWRRVSAGPAFIKVNNGKKGRVLYPKTAIVEWVNQTIKTV
jgi:hypothetical protein